MEDVKYSPIGVVHSPFKERGDVPKELAEVKGVRGSVEVFPPYVDGLKDIEGFSHITIVFHFHLSRGSPLLVRPRWDGALHGVFATHSPDRPNPIGLSVVRLIHRDGGLLQVKGLDMVEGTPVLDIKPYVSQLDRRRSTKAGWLEGHLAAIKPF